jgi:hypothetical protein
VETLRELRVDGRDPLHVRLARGAVEPRVGQIEEVRPVDGALARHRAEPTEGVAAVRLGQVRREGVVEPVAFLDPAVAVAVGGPGELHGDERRLPGRRGVELPPVLQHVRQHTLLTHPREEVVDDEILVVPPEQLLGLLERRLTFSLTRCFQPLDDPVVCADHRTVEL